MIEAELYVPWAKTAMPHSIIPQLSKGIPPEGLTIETKAPVHQRILAEVISALYTGRLDIDESKIHDMLKLVDFLQARSRLTSDRVLGLQVYRQS